MNRTWLAHMQARHESGELATARLSHEQRQRDAARRAAEIEAAWQQHTSKLRGRTGAIKAHASLVVSLREQQNHRCCYCGVRMADQVGSTDVPTGWTLEHIVPRSRRGTDAPDNLAIACHRCNQARGDKVVSWPDGTITGWA